MSEAAAIELSKDPRVKYVEENGIGQLADTPWGLDRIDQLDSVGTVDGNGFTSGTYSPPNDGSGVHVYIIDTGIFISHHQFESRASVATDTVDDDSNPGTAASSDAGGNDGLDCHGHGTLVASIAGGNSTQGGENSFGAVKAVTLHSVRAVMNPTPTPSPSPAPTPARPCPGPDLEVDELINGIDWVAANHETPAVANISAGCYGVDQGCDDAVAGAVAAGVTCVVAAGNGGLDHVADDVNGLSPARESSAITIAAMDPSDTRWSSSNYGDKVDLFAPGDDIRGASRTGVTATTMSDGTSLAAPFVTGLAAMYLYDHSDETSSSPAIVQQVLKSNANICAYDVSPCAKIGSKGTDSPDRLAYTGFLPTPENPIYNHRFFVWQQYSDFFESEPDEGGLDYWTRGITGSCYTVSSSNNIAHVNDNDSCTHEWRNNTSRAFWVVKHPDWFDQNWGLVSNIESGESSNETFVRECYRIYLERDDPDSEDVDFWVSYMNQWGNPAANATGVWETINSFLIAWDYELRFGPHS